MDCKNTKSNIKNLEESINIKATNINVNNLDDTLKPVLATKKRNLDNTKIVNPNTKSKVKNTPNDSLLKTGVVDVKSMYMKPLNINECVLNNESPQPSSDDNDDISITYYDLNREVFSINTLKVNTNRKLYAKFDIIKQGDKRRAVALYDSGADISVISQSYIKTLFPLRYHKILKEIRPVNISVTGFGANKISIAGSLYLPLQFHPYDQIRKVQFLVLSSSVKTTTPVIIGMNAITKFGLNLRNEDIKGFNQPYLCKDINNKNTRLFSSFLSDENLYSGTSKPITLNKGQTHLIKCYLNECSTIEPGTKVVSSQPHFSENDKCILIDQSISTVTEDTFGKYCLANVFVNQITDFKGKISVALELEADFETLPVTHKNIKLLTEQKVNLIHTIDRGKGILDYDYSLFEEANIFYMQKTRFAPHVGCNPEAINNDVKDLHTSLSDQRHPIKESKDLSPKEMAEFNDPSKVVNLNLQEINDETFDKVINSSQGYSLPGKPMTSADVIDFSRYDEDTIDFVKEMFVEKYPEVIPLHSLDCGDMSSLLGKYRLRLKEDGRLPVQKKVYYQSSLETSHMKSILEFMVELQIIAPADTTASGEFHQYSSPAFLISRKDKEATSRLVIDYSGLNSQLLIESCTIPNIDSILHELRGKTFYTNLDISNAFNSISLTEDSAKLTLFSSSAGTYYMKKLGTGLAGSPEILSRIMNKMIHYEICRDKLGNIIWVKEGEAKMVYSKIADCYLFYDDILITTPWITDYETSKKYHFEVVEKVISRLHQCKAKISINKCTIFKSKLLFVGWRIARDFIQVDPKRVEKILNFELPSTTKGWRQFLGCLNSIRPVLGWDVLSLTNKLSNLTSDKFVGKCTEEQKAIFNKLINYLGGAPLFAKLIDQNAPKVVFSDSGGTETGSFCSVLCQVISPENKAKFIPTHFFLDDKNHLLAVERKLECVPTDYIKPNEDSKSYFDRNHIDYPPVTDYLDNIQGSLDPEKLNFSLSKALETLFVCLGLKETLISLGQKIVERGLKSKLYKDNLKYYVIGKDKLDFKRFEQDILKGNFIYDEGNIMIELIAQCLQRCVIVLDAYGCAGDKTTKVKMFNHDKDKPPFFIFLYPCKINDESLIVARPAYISKDLAYDLAAHRGSLEILAWFSKAIPASVAKRHIMDLESYGILCALHSFRKLIGNNPDVMLITDSKTLYFLHHATVKLSSVKISRWSLKMLEDYKHLDVQFTNSRFNLADILTREYNVRLPPSKLLQLPCGISNELENYLPDKRWKLAEWVEYINTKVPNLFEYEVKSINVRYEYELNINKIDSILTDSNFVDPNAFLETWLDLDKTTPDMFSAVNDHYEDKLLSNSIKTQREINFLRMNKDPVNTAVITEIDAESDDEDDLFDRERALQLQISNKSYSLANTCLFKPMYALDHKISYDKIGKMQKISKDTKVIYKKTLLSNNQRLVDGLVKYEILNGVLFITQLPNGWPKIFLPHELLLPLVLSTHLKGAHMGTTQMNLNLTNYHCKGLSKAVKDITKRCLSCFLCNLDTNREMLRVMPCASKPFETVGIDLLENLPSGNVVPDSHFSHIMVVVCLNTGCLLLYPIEKKNSSEWLNVFFYFVYQVFRPRACVMDNAKGFKNMSVAKAMAAGGCNLIDTVVSHPNSKGHIEANVKKVKTMLKKHCALFKEKDWLLSLPLLSQMYNSTRQVNKNYSPFDLIFGLNSRLSAGPMNQLNLNPKINPILLESNIEAKKTSDFRKELSKGVKKISDGTKRVRNDKINVGRSGKKNIKEGDIVFIKRRAKNHKLDTDYHNSAWRIAFLRESKTLCLYQLPTGYVTSAHLDDIKKYEPLSPAFKTLKREIKIILQKPISQWEERDIFELAEHTDLTLPGIWRQLPAEFIANYRTELTKILSQIPN